MKYYKNPIGKRVFLRYPKELLDGMLKTGIIQIINVNNEVKYVPEVAIVEETNGQEDFQKGDEVVVQYLVALDKEVWKDNQDEIARKSGEIYREDKRIYEKYTELRKQMKNGTAAALIQDWHKEKAIKVQQLPPQKEKRNIRNQYFIQKENDDEIRWCWEEQIYGIRRNGKITPTKNFIFCELPEELPEQIGRIYIPHSARKPETSKKGFKVKVKYIRDEEKKSLNLQEGQYIYCDKDTDAVKKIWGEEVIRVPINYILGW